MERKQNKSEKLSEANYKSFLKGQEILKNSINSIEIEQAKYKSSINNVEIQLLKSNSIGFSNPTSINKKSEIKRRVYNKSIKNIYKKYKIFLTKSKYFIKKINLLKFRKYYEQKNFSKHSPNSTSLKYLTTQSYIKYLSINILNLSYFLRKLSRNTNKAFKSIINKFLFLTTVLQSGYLSNILHFERSSIHLYNSIKKESKKSLNSLLNILKNSSISIFFNKKFENQLNIITKNIQKPLVDLLSLDKNKLFESVKRLGFVSYIYFLPFIYLASEALIPYIPEYNYSIVNPLSSQIFVKVPILVELIKLFRPLIIGPNLQLWILIGYFLIFPLGYRSLKLSYKVAYNGTIALIFLMINYSCTLGQEIMRLGFESIKMIKDILFTSYLVKHLGKTKNKEKEVAFSIFNNLMVRYDFQIIEDYYNFILLVSHRVFSQLALISLAALLYNCLYYVIYNKNPEILLVTKAALGTIKNPQEEE